MNSLFFHIKAIKRSYFHSLPKELRRFHPAANLSRKVEWRKCAWKSLSNDGRWNGNHFFRRKMFSFTFVFCLLLFAAILAMLLSTTSMWVAQNSSKSGLITSTLLRTLLAASLHETRAVQTPPVVSSFACDGDHDPVPFLALLFKLELKFYEKLNSSQLFFASSRRAKKNFVAQCADNSATVMEGCYSQCREKEICKRLWWGEEEMGEKKSSLRKLGRKVDFSFCVDWRSSTLYLIQLISDYWISRDEKKSWFELDELLLFFCQRLWLIDCRRLPGGGSANGESSCNFNLFQRSSALWEVLGCLGYTSWIWNLCNSLISSTCMSICDMLQELKAFLSRQTSYCMSTKFQKSLSSYGIRGNASMLCTIHISNAWNYLWYHKIIWSFTALSRSEYLFLLAYLHIVSWDKREENEMKWNTGKLLITKTLKLPVSEGKKHLISIPQIFHQHSTLHEPLLVYKILLAELFTSCEARRRENSSATVPLSCAFGLLERSETSTPSLCLDVTEIPINNNTQHSNVVQTPNESSTLKSLLASSCLMVGAAASSKYILMMRNSTGETLTEPQQTEFLDIEIQILSLMAEIVVGFEADAN